MDRRAFTRGLVSLGLAPAAPLGALVASVGAGIATAATATAEHMYFVSWYTARLNQTCSMDTLVTELNMDADVAREVFGKLVRSNTLSVPDAFGVSKTLDPLRQNIGRVASGGVPSGSGAQAARQPTQTASARQMPKCDAEALTAQQEPPEPGQALTPSDPANSVPEQDTVDGPQMGIKADTTLGAGEAVSSLSSPVPPATASQD